MRNLENRTVLVTGGAGYIGSHACKALFQAGYTPIVYDNFVYGHESAVQWGPSEKGDILDRNRLDEVLSHYAPIAILHFAAFAYVGESVIDPGKFYRNNVAGSLTLLEAARDHNVKRFVFSSSCATYGVPDQCPITEDTQQKPINPYGASKLMVERMLTDFSAAHDFRFVSLRYFNAAGADPDGQVGEDHDPETHLIPLVIDAALGRRANVAIFGTDYETPDGTCIRDYFHVSDLADAHVIALNALLDGSPSQTFNLGLGYGFSVLEVIDAVEHVSGLKVPIEMGPRRPGDPPQLVSDPRKAVATLGWQPKFNDLRAIVDTAWNWHKGHQTSTV